MKHQRIFAIFMCFLLVFTLFAPQIAFAEDSGANQTTLEAELKLEKEMEAESEANDEEAEQTFSGEDGLPRLQDGLDIDKDPQASNEPVEESKRQEDSVDLKGKIDKRIISSLEKKDQVDVIIHMKDKVDKTAIYSKADKIKDRTKRLELVQEQLKSVAEKGQEKVLKELEKNAEVKNIQPLWIINGIAATVTEEALKKIEAREDIDKILFDEIYKVPEVEKAESAPRLPEWGLEKIHAPDVWGTYGVNGEGIVVGIMDTGVEMEHEALQDNYRGKGGDHTYSWADFSGNQYASPRDGNGHGTHVAGTAVGGGSGEPVGVAPGAEWIAVKIFNDSGSATTSGIHQAFQWFMAPGGDPEMAPHVVNNSWGNANTYNTSFKEDVEAWAAAGIFPLFAAGNDGPGTSTIGSPGSFPESFAIGATDSNDQIAGFSSRGPVVWDGVRYVKPEVAAPGQGIYSAWPGNGYHTISGTSMATPHVAGVIALILQSNPELSIDDVKQLLMNTARAESHMGVLPNDIYGNGIVNAYQAVTEAAFAGEVAGTVTDEKGKGIAARVIIEKENIDVAVPADGSFHFKLREGTHDVVVEAFGYSPERTEISIKRGETVEVAWQLQSSAQYRVTGTVKKSGKAVPYAYVSLQDTPLDRVRTNKDGEFSLSGVPVGDYLMAVTGKNMAGKVTEVKVDKDVHTDIDVEASSRDTVPNWQTANNNQARNAISEEDIALEQLKLTKTIKTSGNVIFSSPVVDGNTIVTATDQGRVQAYNLDSGEEKWVFNTGSINRSTPTIAEGLVFVTGGSDKRLYALDVNSGVIRWQKSLETMPIYETPLYEDGTLYISSNTAGQTTVSALEAKTGEVKWTTAVAGGTYFGAALAGDSLILGSFEGGTLHALSKLDGSKGWTFKAIGAGQGFASHPVIVEDTVYAFSTNFVSAGTLWAIDLSTGEERWHQNGIGDTQAASPVVFDDIIIVSSASNPSLKGFDRQTGKLLWENKQVNTAVNNGAAASNGVFLINDSTGTLKAVDVFTGKLMNQWALGGSSSSTPAIVSGQVITGTQSGVHIFSAPGVLRGSVKNGKGDPLEGYARIMGTDVKAEANAEGKFELTALPGEYKIRIGNYGFSQEEETFEFRSGIVHEEEYSLDEVGEGEVTGNITDSRNGKGIAGVTVKVQDTPLEAATDEEGNFRFDSIYEGAYDLTLTAGGYVSTSLSLQVKEGEAAKASGEMSPIDVAVLNDYQETITNLIQTNGISAEERTWEEIAGDVGRYQVLYLNGAYLSGGWKPGKAEMDALLEEARNHGVSVVFADTWGPSYGSIKDLTRLYNDPASIKSENNRTNVTLAIKQEHPIFAGIEAGKRIPTLNNASASAFSGFSGRNLASVISQRDGDMGTGVAYKAVSQNSAHLLLSTFATSSWNQPTQNWLQGQHQILINSLKYLMDDPQFGQLQGKVQDTDGNPLKTKVEVLGTGVTVETDENGQFEVYHDEGSYELEVRSSGYETKKVKVEFEHGEILSETITLQLSNEGQLSGVVTNALSASPIDQVEVKLADLNGEVVADTVTTGNGHYEFSDLNASEYVMTFHHEDYVVEKVAIDMKGQAQTINQALYPAPKVAVIGDRVSGDGTLRQILAENNISAENYTSTAALTDEIGSYDVVFFNEQNSLSAGAFSAFEKAADAHGVSIIYGDMYFSGSGIYQLNQHRKDPAERERLNIRTSPAQYVIEKEHPIFGDRQAGDTVEILTANGSRAAAFDEYSGIELAGIKHEELDERHGTGVAFKPRTGESLELLMSGHSIGLEHYGQDYTNEGLKMFTDAIIWAAYENFNLVEGTVIDSEGKALVADITLEIEGTTFKDRTTAKDDQFSIASVDGEAVVEITSYGYETQTFSVNIGDSLEPFEIVMVEKADVGGLEGNVANSLAVGSLDNVHIEIVGYPREANTNTQGYYRIDTLEPGTYEVKFSKEDFLQETRTVTIEPSEVKILDLELRPSPTVGIIVDSQYASSVKLAEYLEGRGFHTISMMYDDLELLEEVDVVYANSDYNNSLIPNEQTFKRFVEELDRTETSVIWTGQNGGRGSIRYLMDYYGDPAVEYKGSSSTSTISKRAEHPIFEGVDDTFEITPTNGYYYGFDGYSGTVLANISNSTLEEPRPVFAYKGRTINSVELLLGNMTIGNGFHSGDRSFDKNREKILLNSILWAIDHEESYAGEIRGKLRNNMDTAIQGQVTVTETGQTVRTDHEGNFFLSLAEGSYELQLEAFGHESDSVEVEVVNGEILEEAFVLQSNHAGVLKGEVRAAATGDLIEGAHAEIIGTPLTSETAKNGAFEITVPEGEYEVRITASGYQPQTSAISIAKGETTATKFSLQPSEAIALIATPSNQNRLIPFLENNGYEVTAFERNQHAEVKESIEDFALVLVNDSFTNISSAEFGELIEASDTAQVSMVFTGQYGGGAMNDLRDYLGNPASTSTGYVPNSIKYEIKEEHPIFRGYGVGDKVTILANSGGNQQYGVFENYSGTTLADIVHDDRGRIGSGLAYEFRSSGHVHVLLGSLASGSYGSPESRWTNNARIIYMNALDWAMNASQGEIAGTVQDENGDPIERATVTVESEDISVWTNDQGRYSIGIGTGEYTVSVRAVGYEPAEQTVEVGAIGEAVELNFTLERSEQMTLFGQVKEQSSDARLADVAVTVSSKEHDKEWKGQTDADGNYEIAGLIDGSYKVTFKKEGYHPVSKEVMMEEGQDAELNIAMSAFNIAVLGDYKGELSSVLNEGGLAAEPTDWKALDHLDTYEVIVVNTSKGSKEQMEALISQSDEKQISLIFLDTWGVESGSITLLEKALGQPALNQQGYNEGAIYLELDDIEHPIFTGFNSDTIQILADKSPYATFKEYEGNVIAGLKAGEKEKGASIGYDFRSEQHVHVLLSAFSANNMVGPERGWTDDGKQLFVQAIEWAKEAEGKFPSVPVWKQENAEFPVGQVMVTGKADPGATVRILEQEEVLTETTADKNGIFTAKLDLAEGSYEIDAEAVNVIGTARSETPMYFKVTPRTENPGKPPGEPSEPMQPGVR
ncbi:carboxypeptidase regulatory-like domain-containing protein [Cytobacillus purgationiresistens]|uniref:Subtilisin family serine protease/outer membrane protein assembly factor BamB/5-hydroxyisourate hydrolase-like protein (Transthyretin family)/uncharacterized protein YfaP (DUF2135 family) n=1 Tax=Cytobacillus purgationiresistens TaxID=863449 RepID=A0ABU0AN71_9BACI|nr:carboxypeptidase regulatory-like domain-containing protein [Cytobacillus purgationiresistens]MDQ0272726.1 subtilisin family serine protease/outer membrane protein assembly factor BamB/5-hydroxyisourate hydrolase-like protein (transthyretin family)/uncharacterized protein YfaP (DUF2135 family) [Cytobacillus purgationiresistens]